MCPLRFRVVQFRSFVQNFSRNEELIYRGSSTAKGAAQQHSRSSSNSGRGDSVRQQKINGGSGTRQFIVFCGVEQWRRTQINAQRFKYVTTVVDLRLGLRRKKQEDPDTVHLSLRK